MDTATATRAKSRSLKRSTNRRKNPRRRAPERAPLSGFELCLDQLPRLRALGPDTFNWLLEKGSLNHGEYEGADDLIVSIFSAATEDLSNFSGPEVMVEILVSHVPEIAAACAKSQEHELQQAQKRAEQRRAEEEAKAQEAAERTESLCGEALAAVFPAKRVAEPDKPSAMAASVVSARRGRAGAK